jgi:hypothetical protein
MVVSILRQNQNISGLNVLVLVLRFQGSAFLAGFGRSDYNVSFGAGWADDISDISTNEILCLPPDEIVRDDTETQNEDGDSSSIVVDVIVHAGRTHKMLAGTIEYPRKTVAKPANITLIAFSCAVSVLVVALVATIIGKIRLVLEC